MAWGEAVSAFEAALESDSTVRGYSRLREVDDGPQYRITIAESDHQEWVYPVLVRNDVVVLHSRVTADAKILLARFPSWDAVVALRDACEENGVRFSLQHLHREAAATDDGGVDSKYGVTGAQRDALLHALRAGYFDVPRRTRLESMATELDISTQALSTRLRRGQTNLLLNTLALEPDT